MQAMNDSPRAFDTAVTCVPSHLHIPVTTKLVEAGINVFIEKLELGFLDGCEDLIKLIGNEES